MTALYSTELLALATDIPHVGRLDAPTGTATRRSPTCGSQVTVDVIWNGGVTAFAQIVQTCLLGQASAALLGQSWSLDVPALRQAVAGMLAGGPVPDGWDALAPARDVPARHGAILLPLDATVEAIEKSRQRMAGGR